ncbi:chorismate mutase [Arcanobacterium hippocoleae]
MSKNEAKESGRVPQQTSAQENLPSELVIPSELIAYRQTIDNLDAALVHILAERFRCTKLVGELKARVKLPPSDLCREEEQIARLRTLAEESGLDPVFAEKFLKFIVAEVIRHHADIAAKVQQEN